MSVLLKKLLWYQNTNPTQPINITGLIDMSTGRGLDIKNNVLVLTLNNYPTQLDSNGNLQYLYCSDNITGQGQIRFDENDIIKLYLRYSDDMSEVEDTKWSNDTLTEPTTYDLFETYYVIDFTCKQSDNSNQIQVKCADRTYIIFNKLFAYAYTGSTWTAPKIIQHVIRNTSQGTGATNKGVGTSTGVDYFIKADLKSDGGYIQDTRKDTYEDGSVNSDTDFPAMQISKIWKPVYEWIDEISQIEYLNSSAEIEGKLVYGRPFKYYVDENSCFHWFECDNVTTASYDITVGQTTGIYSVNINKKVFDSVNFIIYRGGEDFYGHGTLDYVVDESTPIKNLKMRVIAMTDVAKNMIEDEIQAGNLSANSSGTFTFGGNRYNRNGTVTAKFDNTSYSSDSTYNAALIVAIKKKCKAKASTLIMGLGHARFNGTIERKGFAAQVGTLFTFTSQKSGLNQERLRIIELNHSIDKTGWFTTLSVEQDQEVIIESA